MASSTSNIPPKAVDMLFAEDLINRVLFRHSGEHYNPWRAGPYRDFIFNAFNEEIQRAVDCIDMALDSEIDEDVFRLRDADSVDEVSFVLYAAQYGLFYLPVGFEATNFLYFCVRLVRLAAHFVLSNVPHAPDIAFYFIFKELEDYDMFEGGWDTLINAAKVFGKAYDDFFNILTPDCSDDESLVDSSEEDADQTEDVDDGYFLNREDGLVNNQLEISEEDSAHNMEDLSSPQEGLESCERESTESKKDSKSGLSLERRMSSGGKSLNVVDAPGVSSTPNGEKCGLVSKNSSTS